MNGDEPESVHDMNTAVGSSLESANPVVGGLQTWRGNWLPMIVIAVPLIVGAILVCIAINWMGPKGEVLAVWGIVLQLASAYVATIWIGLGPRTFGRAVIDWVAIVIIFYSMFLIQLSADKSVMNALDPQAAVAIFFFGGLFNLALSGPFVLFRGELVLFHSGDVDEGQFSIADLLTMTGLIAMLLGSLRLDGLLVGSKPDLSQVSTMPGGMYLQFVVQMMVFILFASVISLIICVIFGMPLVAWAYHVRRKTRSTILLCTCLGQVVVAIASVITAGVISGSRFDQPPIFIGLVALVFQAFVFLILAALMVVQFRQGDLIDSATRLKTTVDGKAARYRGER